MLPCFPLQKISINKQSIKAFVKTSVFVAGCPQNLKNQEDPKKIASLLKNLNYPKIHKLQIFKMVLL